MAQKAYVPGFQHDIFVSYAHVDNKPLPHKDHRWVTTLVGTLKRALAQKLGRDDVFSVWTDDSLKVGDLLTPEIVDNLSKSAMLLIILSPGYLASSWCIKEKDTFLEILNSRKQGLSNIIVVERDRLDDNTIFTELNDSITMRFWVAKDEKSPSRTLGDPDPESDKEGYWNKINDLVHSLSEKIKNLKKYYDTPQPQGATDTVQTPKNHYKTTLFLAEVTDDLDPFREEVKRYLDQQQIRVLPEKYYPPDPQAYKDALIEDFKKSSLFVQLLSNVAGKRPAGIEQGYNCLQYDLALKQGLPIMQWFTPDQKIETVQDDVQRELLGKATVLQVTPQSFKKEIVRKTLEIIKIAEKPPAPGPVIPSALSVFVNSASHDIELANKVEKIVSMKEMTCVLPVHGESAEEIRKDLEDNLLFCDALIVIYGHTTRVWVREQLRNNTKITWKRSKERPLRALAVYEGPPDDKEDIKMNVPGMRIINCRRGHDEAAVLEFLALLQEASHE